MSSNDTELDDEFKGEVNPKDLERLTEEIENKRNELKELNLKLEGVNSELNLKIEQTNTSPICQVG